MSEEKKVKSPEEKLADRVDKVSNKVQSHISKLREKRLKVHEKLKAHKAKMFQTEKELRDQVREFNKELAPLENADRMIRGAKKLRADMGETLLDNLLPQLGVEEDDK